MTKLQQNYLPKVPVLPGLVPGAAPGAPLHPPVTGYNLSRRNWLHGSMPTGGYVCVLCMGNVRSAVTNVR